MSKEELTEDLSLVSRESPMLELLSPQRHAVHGLTEARYLPSHTHTPPTNSTFISEWGALEMNTPPQKLSPEPRKQCTLRHRAMPFKQLSLASRV